MTSEKETPAEAPFDELAVAVAAATVDAWPEDEQLLTCYSA